MKERIKQLQFQAAAQIPPLLVDSEWQREFTKKFAELIIRDCTDIINKRKDAAIEASWNVDEAMSNAVWDIESHFYGVDE
jgi:hypothetical protein